jgi:MSHA biogenesis protein MshJ
VKASKDPGAANRARLAALQEQLGTIDAALAEKTAGLVSPQEMARLVEEILKQNRKLQLVKIESLAPAPLGESKKQEQAKPAVAEPEYVIYRHGTRIELKGRYLDIVDYLKTLEQLPWKVFWGEAVLETDQYPVSTFTLVLYTLSLREGWIGV